jgi:hypothetical protein
MAVTDAGSARALRTGRNRTLSSSEAQRRGPQSTSCGNVVHRLIRNHGVEHVTIVLRMIVEIGGKEGELIEDYDLNEITANPAAPFGAHRLAL